MINNNDDTKNVDIKNLVTEEKLKKYFDITGEAIAICTSALDESRLDIAKDFLDMSEIAKRINSFSPDDLAISEHDQKILKEIFLDMARRYYSDAKYFYAQKDLVLAFGALNYAHGWLDAGARIRLFQVNDSRLFTVDDK